MNSGSEVEKAELKLKDMIPLENIRIGVDVKDKEEAIRAAGRILVDNGYVEERFIDAMIKILHELGPYIVIAKGIALPHARPEDGVKRPGMALITLKNPVNFGSSENDPVDIVIALAAKDSSSHVKALAQLARFLSERDKVEKIRRAKKEEEIYEVIKEYSEDSGDAN
ncbi:MAG: PTS sugar transporter subunit IIA [Candidatus Asgardarchaeia archaeon]